MNMERERCRGMTVKGRRCKLHAIEGRRFCRHHLPEEQKVRRFVKEHKQELIRLLEQEKSDPVVRELYTALERRIERRHQPLMAREQALVGSGMSNGQVKRSAVYQASHAHSMGGMRSMAIF